MVRPGYPVIKNLPDNARTWVRSWSGKICTVEQQLSLFDTATEGIQEPKAHAPQREATAKRSLHSLESSPQLAQLETAYTKQ